MTGSTLGQSKHRLSLTLSMIALVLVLAGLFTPVSGTLGGTSADAWDVSRGTVVTAHSGTLGRDDPLDMFGAAIGFGDAHMLFADFRPVGFVHFVEWQTPVARTIRHFNLSAFHDQHIDAPAGECDLSTGFRDAQHRGFSHFTLKAFNTATAAFDIVLYDMAIPLGDDNSVHPGENARLYDPTGALNAFKSFLDLSANVPAVATDRWRAEFTQVGCPSNESGPRIQELDGFLDPLNGPPTADAGPDQAARIADTVALDGTGSFDDNTATGALLYNWEFTSVPAGSSAALVGAQTSVPSFTVDAFGTYAVQLVVTDEAGLVSLPDEVLVSSENLAPTADAGDDRLVLTGTTVTLDGSGSSDPEDDPLSFQWAIESAPAGSTVQLSVTTLGTAHLTPDVNGVYEIELVVSDFVGPSEPDTVVVTAVDATTYAEIKLIDAADVIRSLPDGAFDAIGHRNAMLNHLAHAVQDLSADKHEHARHDILLVIERTDGCARRGTPDGNGGGRDWITNCADQEALYPLLIDALDTILP